jgi:glycosyltransferase involved in cell wall biosynthesis
MDPERSPLLSIILPNRYSEDVLHHTIASILDSDDNRFQLLIAENSYPTHISLDEYMTDPRVKVIRNNCYLPMSENWLSGLKEADGEWFCFIGSDDGIVSQNLKYFLNLMTETEYDVIIGCTSGFNYGTYIKPPSINIAKNKNTLRKTKVKWPVKRVAAFHKTNYDLPQPYNKAFARKILIQEYTNELGRIPGYAPDIFLGYLLALKSKKGLYFDLNMFIRGTSERSNGFQLINSPASANSVQFIEEVKPYLGPLANKYSLTCRVAMQIDHFIFAHNFLGGHITSKTMKCLLIWCELTCENREHHTYPLNRDLIRFISFTVDFISITMRRFWLLKNFKIHLPSRNVTLKLTAESTVVDAARLLKF